MFTHFVKLLRKKVDLHFKSVYESLMETRERERDRYILIFQKKKFAQTVEHQKVIRSHPQSKYTYGEWKLLNINVLGNCKTGDKKTYKNFDHSLHLAEYFFGNDKWWSDGVFIWNVELKGGECYSSNICSVLFFPYIYKMKNRLLVSAAKLYVFKKL